MPASPFNLIVGAANAKGHTEPFNISAIQELANNKDTPAGQLSKDGRHFWVPYNGWHLIPMWVIGTDMQQQYIQSVLALSKEPGGIPASTPHHHSIIGTITHGITQIPHDIEKIPHVIEQAPHAIEQTAKGIPHDIAQAAKGAAKGIAQYGKGVANLAGSILNDFLKKLGLSPEMLLLVAAAVAAYVLVKK